MPASIFMSFFLIVASSFFDRVIVGSKDSLGTTIPRYLHLKDSNINRNVYHFQYHFSLSLAITFSL